MSAGSVSTTKLPWPESFIVNGVPCWARIFSMKPSGRIHQPIVCSSAGIREVGGKLACISRPSTVGSERADEYMYLASICQVKWCTDATG